MPSAAISCGGQAMNALALKENLSLFRFVETGQDIEERRLAGAVGADQSQDFPFFDGQVDVVQRRHAAEELRDR